MTAPRQERNDIRPDAGFRRGMALISRRAALGWVSLAVLECLPHPVRAATTERVVVNRFSGLAIEGFDPVAYFVDQSPMLGLPAFEAAEAGVVWRFHNEGNRASFLAHPEIYGPQFGGYDPIDLGRGVTVAGNPRFFLVSGQRLYLFGREQNRDAFAADPERALRAANLRWPALEQGLAQ
jgi:hypothetical protein